MSGDYDGPEPIPGLPERLPMGERILWQGAPDWRLLARRGFHVPEIACYFGALVVWNVASSLLASAPLVPAALSALRLVGLGAAAVALLVAFCWAVGRTTVYTFTNRRVAMRFGIALPMTINLPYSRIDGADLKARADGSGDIALTLQPGNRLAYFMLWPHVRPWRLTRTQPMLRGLADAAGAAQCLSRALAAAASMPAPAIAPAPATAAASARPQAAAA